MYRKTLPSYSTYLDILFREIRKNVVKYFYIYSCGINKERNNFFWFKLHLLFVRRCYVAPTAKNRPIRISIKTSLGIIIKSHTWTMTARKIKFQNVLTASRWKIGRRGELHQRFVAVRCNKKFCDRIGKKKRKKKRLSSLSRHIMRIINQSQSEGRRLPQEAISSVEPVANKTLRLQVTHSSARPGDPVYLCVCVCECV